MTREEKQDEKVPGEEYLCQINETTSCGACCGLYNLADTSRASMTAMLAQRSDLFSRTPRTVTAIDGFAAYIARIESAERPFKEFHHCPFIGMIGQSRTRVGCLLHPLGAGNDGVDYRGMSYYGGMACHSYFCPSHHELCSDYKHILRFAVTDWHLYGLIITEKNLIQAMFGHIEKRFRAALKPHHFQNNPRATRSLVDLLTLKLIWPYRPPGLNTDCHYFFREHPFPRRPIRYAALGRHPSPWNDLIIELNSEFNSSDDLLCAERMIKYYIKSVVHDLRCGFGTTRNGKIHAYSHTGTVEASTPF